MISRFVVADRRSQRERVSDRVVLRPQLGGASRPRRRRASSQSVSSRRGRRRAGARGDRYSSQRRLQGPLAPAEHQWCRDRRRVQSVMQ